MARQNSKTTGNKGGDGQKPVVIKKYANRRLYNTATSSYVTLDHLCQMVKDDVDFAVYDAKTGEDITRSVLTQIIVEEENKGTNLLPINFLRQLISFYGDNMQAVVPSYLEHMMQAFAANQDRMREQMRETMSGMFPFGGDLQKMSEQNAALFDSAIKMFAPFGAPGRTAGEGESASAQSGGTQPGGPQPGGGQPAAEQSSGQADAESLQQLKKQVDLLQQQLEVLTRDQGQTGPTGGNGNGSSADRPAPAAGGDKSKRGEAGSRSG